MLHNQKPKIQEDGSLLPAITMDLAKRQAFGAYYTPFSIATILAKWSIRDADNFILEPCFGGCDFLEAVKEQLKFFSNFRYAEHIYGCDIDTGAFSHLDGRLGVPVDHSNFILRDFLSCEIDAFQDKKFDVIIGNPPYIKTSRLSKKQKESIENLPSNLKKIAGPRANLWAYFILHSLNFLKVGGRLSMVLPGNILSSDYAKKIQDELCRSFKKIIAVSISERLFVDQGTEERTVILLCDGFGEISENGIEIRYCNDIEKLQDVIDQNPISIEQNFHGIGKSQLSSSEYELFKKIAQKSNVVTLSSIAKISIGIVLGDKNFFVKKKTEWEKISINEKFLIPIVSQVKTLKGIELTLNDVTCWEELDEKCYFINTKINHDEFLKIYLESHPKKQNGENKTFLKRSVWHQPDDEKISHAFLGGLHDIGPKLVLNTANLQNTNSLYRVVFLEPDKNFQKMVCISLLSTFSQLSAELEGRPMGSGALKLEPKDALRILVSSQKIEIKKIDKTFLMINDLMKYGYREEASDISDELLYSDVMSKSEKEIFRNIIKRVRSHRRREY
ncbi:MAG: HsdM family class I SAM-dependent methyltransferase [Janthinobacterium svalbardensis]